MEIELTKTASADFKKIKMSGNSAVQDRLSRILEDLAKNQYTVGKPEALKYKYSGYLSIELTKKDRTIYKVDEEREIITIYQFLGHYFDK